MATTINYLSLTGLQKYDVSIKEFIAAQVAAGDEKSFKYVNLENGVLKFYTVNPIATDTVPDFEIELPEQDLSNLMQLVANATAGNIAVFGENGQVKDGGVAVTDIAVKSEVEAVDAKVDALDAYIGDIPEGYTETNIVAYINKKAEETLSSASGGSTESAASVLQALNTYKAENNPKVAANTEAAAAAQAAADAAQVAADAAQADIDAFLASAEVGEAAVDTLKEIQAYITSDGEAAALMTQNIADNAARLDVLEKIDHEAYVAADAELKAELESAINAKADSSVVTALDEAYKAADTALGDRIAVVEGKAHVHANADVLNGITAENVTAWSNAEVNAKAYVDEQIGEVDLSGIETNASAITTINGRVDTIENDVSALKAVEHVEITAEQIENLFA